MELLRSALVDSSEAVVQAALHVYLPSLAMWTSKYSELGPRLVEPQFLALLDPHNLAASTLAINGLRKVIPHIYANVVRSGPWRDPEHDFEVDPTLVEATRRRYHFMFQLSWSERIHKILADKFNRTIFPSSACSRCHWLRPCATLKNDLVEFGCS